MTNKNNNCTEKSKSTKLISNIFLGLLVFGFLFLILMFLPSNEGVDGFKLFANITLLLMLFPIFLIVIILGTLFGKDKNEISEKCDFTVNMILKYRIKNIKDYYEINSDEVDKDLIGYKKMIASYLNGDFNKILDLGVGTGDELEQIYLKFPMVIVKAIDLREQVGKPLKERFKGIDFVCGDFFSIDFEGSYDAVIASNSLCYYDYNLKFQLYKKIYECLEPGKVFISLDKFF